MSPWQTAAGASGVASACRHLAEALARRDDVEDVVVLSPADETLPPEVGPSGVRVVMLRRQQRLTLAANGWPDYLSVRRWARDEGLRPDVVHGQGFAGEGHIAVRLARHLGVPSVVTVHGMVDKEARLYSDSMRAWLAARVMRQTLRGASGIVFVSPYRADELVLRSGTPSRVIENAIADAAFDPAPAARPPAILYAGFIGPRKRLLDVVAAVESLRARVPGVRLRIAGPERDAAYAAGLRAEISARGVEDVVDLLGPLTQEDLYTEYRSARALVLASEEENAPQVIGEAMAAGVPVVATDVGGVRWMVQDGVSGFLVGVGDVDTLAARMEEILTDDATWSKTSRAAREDAERFRADRVAAETMRLYAELAGPRTSSRDEPARPRRVVIMNASLNVGGAERILAELARRIDPARFAVDVFCLYAAGPVGETLRRDGVRVTDRFLRHKGDVLGFVRLVAALRRLRPDVLYYNNQPLTQLWGLSAAVVARVPAVVTVFHFMFRRRKGARRGVLLNRLLGRRIDACVVLSERHKHYVVEAEHIAPGKVAVIPNGIDTGEFAAAPGRRDQVRAELGVDASRTVVAIVAQLRPEKNHAMFLRAAHQVLQQHPDTVFLVVGDGDERDRLQALARELDLEAAVKFLGVRSDVADVMAAADVGVLCSFGRVEAFPLSVLELMAAGRAVVSTDVGSVDEIVTDGETGLLVPQGDAHALATAIESLVADPERRAAMGEAGRAKAVAHFDVKTMVDRTQTLLVETLSRKARPHASDRPTVVVVGPRPRLQGGVNTHVRTLLSGRLDEQFEVVHLEVGFYTERVSRAARLRDALSKIRELRSLLRRRPGAVVHLNPSMDTRSLIRDLTMLRVAARLGSPTVLQFHGGLMDRPRPMRFRLVRRLVRRALERADVVLVLSRAQERSIVETLGDGTLRLEKMSAYFLDPRPYDERLEKRRSSGRVRSFAFVGRLVEEKGVHELIEAAAVLRGEGLDVVVEIAGAGPDEASMRRRCTELGMDEFVRWLGHLGDLPKLDLLAACDAFVLASAWLEGLPNALLEAMTMALPVIVSDAGAMAEVIEDGVNGFVVPARDTSALVERMRYLVENPAEAAAMGARNKEIATQRYTLDKQVETFGRIYREVATRHTRGRRQGHR